MVGSCPLPVAWTAPQPGQHLRLNLKHRQGLHAFAPSALEADQVIGLVGDQLTFQRPRLFLAIIRFPAVLMCRQAPIGRWLAPVSAKGTVQRRIRDADRRRLPAPSRFSGSLVSASTCVFFSREYIA